MRRFFQLSMFIPFIFLFALSCGGGGGDSSIASDGAAGQAGSVYNTAP